MKNYKKNLFIFSTLLISSCSHLHDYSYNSKEERVQKARPVVFNKFDSPKVFLSVENSKKDNSKPIKVDEDKFELTYKKNHYNSFIKYFSKKKSLFNRYIKRAERFEEIVMGVLEEEGLPKELFYVGLIESGYSTAARSHASAVGPWQFIRGTGKKYGLSINSSIDERRSIYKATRAAAAYFKDLYNIFGNWELALCAYNAGEYRVIRAIRKGNTRNFIELANKRLLPKETIHYVPKIAAAMELYNNRKKYKLLEHTNPSKIYLFPRSIEVASKFDTEKFRKSINISKTTFKKLNPDFNYKVVSPNKGKKIRVFLPKGTSTDEMIKARSYALRNVKSKRSSRKQIARSKYIVRPGDNLSTISRKVGLSVSKIKRLNKISGSKILVGQKLMLNKASKKTHRVRRGDNLIAIAKRYGVSVSQIKRKNGLKSSRIYPNQTIKL